jgi:hypothetical protein
VIFRKLQIEPYNPPVLHPLPLQIFRVKVKECGLAASADSGYDLYKMLIFEAYKRVEVLRTWYQVIHIDGLLFVKSISHFVYNVNSLCNAIHKTAGNALTIM